MKLSIKDYSTLKSISLQAVYQACKKQRIKCIEENGKRYVVVDAEEVKPVKQAVDEDQDKSIVKELLKQLKSKDKEIKRITKELAKCNESKEGVFIQYIQELKQLQLPKPEEVIIKAKKKKKKKR